MIIIAIDIIIILYYFIYCLAKLSCFHFHERNLLIIAQFISCSFMYFHCFSIAFLRLNAVDVLTTTY